MRGIRKISGHDSLLAGVIRSDREAQVTTKELNEPGEIRHASSNVLSNLEPVTHAQAVSGFGHQLH